MAIDGGSVEIRFEGDVAPLRRSVEEAVESLEEVKQAAQGVDKSLSESSFEGFGKKAKQEFRDFADSASESFADAFDAADDFIGQLRGVNSALKGVAFGALTTGATAAAGALVKMAKGAIQDTSALENIQIQMIGLTHSTEAGNKAMAMAVEYFKNNPFNRFEVTNATKSLIQFGAELDEIPGLLDKLGKVSLSTGSKIDTLAYYYQRMISDGRIGMMDLLQMQTQNIPIMGALAKRLGTTAGGIRELSRQGKISVEDFKAAFEDLVDSNAMERFNETFSRQVDRFKGRMSNMRAALAGYTTSIEGGLEISANGLYRSVTRFLRTFSDIMDSDTGKRIYEGFEKIGNAIAGFIDKISSLMAPAMDLFGKMLNFIGDNSELLIPILGGLLVALGKVGSLLPGIGGVIDKVSGSFGLLKDRVFSLVSTHPLLSAFVALLGVGFADAMKNDEEFRKTIGELTGALREMFSNLMEAVRGVLPVFVNLIKELASSGAIKTVLIVVANALNMIAKAVASIPPEALAGIMSFILSLKLLNANPLMFVVTAITLLIQYIKELGGVSKVFEQLPQKLATIGHNLMTGLFNGIKDGARKVFNYVKQVASTILSTFKNMFGIHSPSTVMYDMGINMGLGLANGITDSEDAVSVAMNNLAEDILKQSEKIISNKVDFGILDIKQEWQEWKKVSKLFNQGSEQYNYALEQMENARKKANLKILDLQRTYNETLDRTIDKIASMYGLFDEVNLGGSKNSSQILKNLDQQVAKMQEWSEAQQTIANLGLDDKLVDELKAMGVDATGELSAISQMTSDELATLNNLWLQKQKIANDAGIKQMEGMKNDTINEVKALKDGIDGVTVDIADSGGRLVENISEGVYGAMPTLESAFGKLNDYIEKAQRELAKSMGGSGSGLDSNLGGADALGVPDTGIAGIKEEITNSLEKVKSMLPNILLGMISAWGAVKFGPKVLKALFNKIGQGLMSGGLGAQGIAGSLFKSADLGLGLRDGLLEVIDHIPREDYTVSGKILNKIQGWLSPKETSQVAETAKQMTKTSKPVQKIAESSTQISQSIQTTGQSFSKASGWMNSIQQGAKTVIYVAGAIAAVAGALWITYNALKDVDFGKLALQLIAMGLAVVEFGALAKAADMLKVSAKSILIIVGIAIDIAAVALACGTAYNVMKDIPWDGFGSALGMMASAIGAFGLLNGILGIKVIALAEGIGLLISAGIIAEIVALSHAIKEAYDAMKDISWEGFGNMLGQMAAALGAMGALNAPLGLLMPLAALGWVSISLICDEMVKLAKALVEVDKNVPEDFDALEKKLKHIKHTLEIINGLDLGTVIGMMVTSWSAGPVERIMEMYVKVAEALNKLSKIELDRDAIEANLEYIRSTLETIDAKTDIISGWLEASRMDVEASSIENAGRIVIVYGNMVDALDKLANFKPDEAGISASLLAMVGVITLLRNQSYGGGGLFTIFTNMETVANDVEKIKSIVKNYLEMVPTMQDLGKPENTISSGARATVEKNIENIKSIVLAIGSVDTGGWVDQKESDIQKIQSILNKFTELEPVMWQISQFNMSYTEDAKKRIKDIRDLVLEVGRVDTGGWIDQKESDMGKIQSILNKFTEVAKTCGLLKKYPIPENAQGWIQSVRHLVWEIGQINQNEAGSLDAKAEIIEKSKTIATKLGEFASIVNTLEGTDKGGVIESLTSSLNQLLDGVSNSLSEKTAVFENVGVKMGQSLASGVKSQNLEMQLAGIELQSSFWSAIEQKMNDEYQQGAWMATQFGNGLKSISFDNIGAQMQSSLWWAIQNRMQDEYYQGQTMGLRFRQGLYDVDYGNAGWWAVKGFENGAWSLYGSVYNTGWWIADRFLRGLRDRGEQGSPWKTTMESGSWAVEGLIEGMKSSETALVGEATSLADQVVNALTMDNLTMEPTLDANISGRLAPSMAEGEYAIIGGNGGGVTVQQTNNNYTQYDVEQVQRDLAWELSKV